MSHSDLFPPEEFQTRLRRVEEALERAGLDALVAYAVKNQPGPVAYLCGYEPGLGLHDVAFLTVSPGSLPRCALLTNAFWDRPEELASADEVHVTGDFGPLLARLLPRAARRIGIAGYRFFPAPIYTVLQAALPDVRLEDATPLLMEVAAVKSPAEVAVIRRCVRTTDAGGRAFLSTIREGASERDIQAEVERAIRLAGADGLSFATQVYSGPQVAVGMGFCADRVLSKGEQVQVDCGAVQGGYRGDLSRVATVGPPTDAVRALMEATAEMYEAMLTALRPGVPAREVAQAGVRAAAERGMGSSLYRSPNHPPGFVGHGIGCWYHEQPEICPDSTQVLQANMVVVLEPILVNPAVGGAKIEDAVLVTPQGPERLSGLDIRTWLG